MKSNALQLSHRIEAFIEASCTNNIHTGEKNFCSYHFEKVVGRFISDKVKNRVVYFGQFESFLHF